MTTRTDSAVTPAGTRAMRPTRAPLLALLGANAISLAGSMMTYLALPWFVLATTGSPALTGLTATCQAVAAVVAAIGGGALIDRLGHMRASVVADVASGAIVAAIPTLSHTIGLAFWQLLALVFARSLCDTPGGTARGALLPDAAARAGLAPERANAWFQAIQRGARLLGAPLAGVLIAALGPSPVLWIDAATFFASAAIVAGARPAQAPAATPEPGPEGRYLARVALGLRFIRRDRVLLALVGALSLLNGLESPLYGVILPVYAKRTFGSAVDLGLLMAGVGGGATVGALVFGALGPRLPRRATLIGAFLVLGLPFWALALAPPLAVAAGVLVVAGLAAGPINPLIATVQQERVPAALRGRVFGALTAVGFVVTPLGLALGGYLLERIGLRATLLAIATCYLTVTLSMLVNPALRDLSRPPRPGEATLGSPWDAADERVAGADR